MTKDHPNRGNRKKRPSDPPSTEDSCCFAIQHGHCGTIEGTVVPTRWEPLGEAGPAGPGDLSRERYAIRTGEDVQVIAAVMDDRVVPIVTLHAHGALLVGQMLRAGGRGTYFIPEFRVAAGQTSTVVGTGGSWALDSGGAIGTLIPAPASGAERSLSVWTTMAVAGGPGCYVISWCCDTVLHGALKPPRIPSLNLPDPDDVPGTPPRQ